jgi:hypothetical protein
MSTYNALQGPASSLLNSNISSPYNNTGFNTRMAMGTQTNAGLGASAGASTRQANTALGTTGGGAFTNYQNAAQGRANAANQGRMANNLILGAAQNRNTSLNAAMNYRPLQTGGTQVQQTSGLGTWLPQVIGAGLSVAGSFMGDPGLGSQVMGATGHGAGASAAGAVAGGMSPFFSGSGGGGTPFSSGMGQNNFNNWANGGYGGAPIMNPVGGPFQGSPSVPDNSYGLDFSNSPFNTGIN